MKKDMNVIRFIKIMLINTIVKEMMNQCTIKLTANEYENHFRGVLEQRVFNDKL